MTRLPDRNLPEGTKQPETTTGEFRLAMGNLRQFIADLLGTDSADKQDARNIFGVQEKYRAEASGTPDELAATFAPRYRLPRTACTSSSAPAHPTPPPPRPSVRTKPAPFPSSRATAFPFFPATVTGSNSNTMPNWKNGSLKTPPSALPSCLSSTKKPTNGRSRHNSPRNWTNPKNCPSAPSSPSAETSLRKATCTATAQVSAHRPTPNSVP